MKLDEFSTPHTRSRDSEGNDVVTYHLEGLRPLKGADPVRPLSALEACVNTSYHKLYGTTPGHGFAWANTRQRGALYYRRTIETRAVYGQMIKSTATARSIVVRRALEMARREGYATLIVRHES